MSINNFQPEQINHNHIKGANSKQEQAQKLQQLKKMIQNLGSFKGGSKSNVSQHMLQKMDVLMQSMMQERGLERMVHNALDVLHEIDPNMLQDKVDELVKPYPLEADMTYNEKLNQDFVDSVEALENFGFSQSESEYALRLHPNVYNAYLYLFYQQGASYDDSDNPFDISNIDNIEDMTVADLQSLSHEIIEDKSVSAKLSMTASGEGLAAMAEALSSQNFDSIFDIYQQHMSNWESLGESINIDEIESKKAEDITLGDLTKLYMYYGSYQGPKLDDYHPSLQGAQGAQGVPERGGNFTMGEINKLVVSQRVSFEKYMKAGASSRRMGSHMDEFVQQMLGLSSEEQMEMIRSMIDTNGIESIKELTMILKLVGELGISIDVSLLKDIQEAIEDFLENIHDMVSDPVQMMALLESISAMVQSPAFNVSEINESLEDVFQDLSQKIEGVDNVLQSSQSANSPASMNGLNITFVNPDEVVDGDVVTDDVVHSDTISQSASQSASAKRSDNLISSAGLNLSKNKEIDATRRVEKIEDKDEKIELLNKILRDVRDVLEHLEESTNEYMIKQLEGFHKEALNNVLDKAMDARPLEAGDDISID